MDFEYKNFDGENTTVIEIVSDISTLGLLKRCGNKNIIVCLPLELCIGKLNSITPFNRSNLIQYCKTNDSFDFTNSFDKLIEVVKNSKKIRVWTNHLDCSEYCLLLLICYLFSDKEISAIYSEELNNVSITSAVSEKEIIELEKIEHILTNDQKQNYCKEWIKIVSDNKELRYMLDGNVVSCSIDKFDNEIIDRLEKNGKIYIYKLVADLMNNPIIPCGIYPDWIYIYLIEKLEKNGVIKSFLKDNKKYIELNE